MLSNNEKISKQFVLTNKGKDLGHHAIVDKVTCYEWNVKYVRTSVVKDKYKYSLKCYPVKDLSYCIMILVLDKV